MSLWHLTVSRAALAATAAVGLAAGLGIFTFGYAKGYSYLTNDPRACANCHVMTEHFDAWTRSTHRAVATCNDCHTPHALVPKYVVKAKNGFWHSFYFTTGTYPDPLRITEGNRRITERACRDCHAQITEAIDPASTHAIGLPPARRNRSAAALLQVGAPQRAGSGRQTADRGEDRLSCARCHTHVGHWVR